MGARSSAAGAGVSHLDPMHWRDWRKALEHYAIYDYPFVRWSEFHSPTDGEIVAECIRRCCYLRARDRYHRESLSILDCDTTSAVIRINRHADEAAESVRRSHGQYFRHLKQWINDKGEHA